MRVVTNREEWLKQYRNPLGERLGRDFFLSIPRKAGVYFFYGRYAGLEDALLYVGKAKVLRERLASYRRATPESVSRKILWMIQQTQRIEWETCSSERSALLRENELLRSLRPPYNILNTEPESYVFIALKQTNHGIRFRVTSESPENFSDRERFFGAFKSRGSVREAYGAFLRLLWICTSMNTGNAGYELPATLLRYKPANPYLLPCALPRRWDGLIDSFFSGRSRKLLTEMTRALLENAAISPLLYPRIQDDLDNLQTFFRSYCSKNRRMCRHFGRSGSLIAQDEIDDWQVLYRLTASR